MLPPKPTAAVNGYNVPELQEYIARVRTDPSVAERNPVLKATWVGGSRARVAEGDKTLLHVGGDDEPSAMKLLLAMLAACDVEAVSTHAALMGLKLEKLEIEARGHFDVRQLLGVDGPPPGYDRVTYTVKLRAPGATREQIAKLREVCEKSSPVGDTLARKVPVTLEFVAER